MNPQGLVIAALAACLAGFGGGWKANGWRLDAAHTAQVNADLKAAREALRVMTADRDTKAAALRKADDAHQLELKGARDETTKLRDCVRAGTCGLRIVARCPTVPSGTTPASTPGVDTATGTELAGSAQQAYFDLRDGINATQAQLSACQDELRVRSDLPH